MTEKGDISHYTAEFVKGDLVVFTGYLSSPDIVYEETYDDRHMFGIVLSDNASHYGNTIYRVYWLKHDRVVETVSAHMRLAYIRK